ncbi:MAG TPA: glucuronate isomerase, partial [Armatimonadota bacterium]|nr:glucuronate isomerase [Armatimonadota bacterium]
TTLSAFGLDVAARDLARHQAFFAGLSPAEHIERVFELARVSHVVMTNDPFDAAERAVWLEGVERDPRFLPALRVDRLMGAPESVAAALAAAGHAVTSLGALCDTARRFLDEWADRMDPIYLAMSLPSDYTFPEASLRGRMMAECIVPFCRERGLPLALMIGVKRQVNPRLGLAGDAVGRCSVDAVEALCAQSPDVRFLVTLLSRENQHELCVSARKFPNLMPFGCWWFLNNPSIIEEMTLERLELLGLSFIPQHSDARVLDQLVYKWSHSRAVIADVLCRKYDSVLRTGWALTEDEIRRDAEMLLRGNFIQFARIESRVG